MTATSSKLNFLYTPLKWVLGACSLGYLAWKWYTRDVDQSEAFFSLVKAHWVIFIPMFVLMFVNWGLEAQKFRVLLRQEGHISFVRSFFIVLAGTTISNFTPARTGDYIGRTVILKERDPLKVILATLAGNLSQLSMTYLLGFIATVLALITFNSNELSEIIQSNLASILTVIGGIILLIIVVPFILKRRSRRLPSVLADVKEVLVNYRTSELRAVVGLSFLRYLTFNVQFFIVLSAFSSDGLSIELAIALPVIFMLQSVVPVPAVTDLGVRLFFTSIFFGSILSTAQITAAVLGLWAVNLIVPALIGALYIFYSLFADR